LIIGTICIYILSVFLLLPVLYWNDHCRESKKAAQVSQLKGEGFVERVLRKLTPVVVKNPVIIILLAIVLCVAGFILDSRIDAETDPIQYLSKDLQSIKNIQVLVDLTGGRQNASILVEADDVATPKVLNWMLEVQQTIKTNETTSVGTVKSIADVITQSTTDGKIPNDSAAIKETIAAQIPAQTLNLVTSDYKAANIELTFPRLSPHDLRNMKSRLEGYTSNPPSGITAAVTGSTILQDNMASGLTTDREKMTYFGIAFVFVGLLLLFRFRLKRAIVAALPTVFIIGWAAIIVYYMGVTYNPLGATRCAMSMGIGVMFTILLMSRYYEQRDHGQTPFEAITSTMVAVGRPIIACGLTVIGGFAALQMATDFPMITDFGIITLLTVFFGLVATLIVLPPMLVLTDSWFGKPSAQVNK